MAEIERHNSKLFPQQEELPEWDPASAKEDREAELARSLGIVLDKVQQAYNTAEAKAATDDTFRREYGIDETTLSTIKNKITDLFKSGLADIKIAQYLEEYFGVPLDEFDFKAAADAPQEYWKSVEKMSPAEQERAKAREPEHVKTKEPGKKRERSKETILKSVFTSILGDIAELKNRPGKHQVTVPELQDLIEDTSLYDKYFENAMFKVYEAAHKAGFQEDTVGFPVFDVEGNVDTVASKQVFKDELLEAYSRSLSSGMLEQGAEAMYKELALIPAFKGEFARSLAHFLTSSPALGVFAPGVHSLKPVPISLPDGTQIESPFLAVGPDFIAFDLGRYLDTYEGKYGLITPWGRLDSRGGKTDITEGVNKWKANLANQNKMFAPMVRNLYYFTTNEQWLAFRKALIDTSLGTGSVPDFKEQVEERYPGYEANLAATLPDLGSVLKQRKEEAKARGQEQLGSEVTQLRAKIEDILEDIITAKPELARQPKNLGLELKQVLPPKYHVMIDKLIAEEYTVPEVKSSSLKKEAIYFNLFSEYDKVGSSWQLDKETNKIMKIDLEKAIREGGVWEYKEGDTVHYKTDNDIVTATIVQRLPFQKYLIEGSLGNRIEVTEKELFNEDKLF